ncbi:MAG: acetyl-CoA carboxylase carboxyltransferase subunit alpha [Nitrospirae bacterium]|nr:acetyl-CoA carboxylase carboxyltransferase subunit alpha [Nitrospirota bacterium]
MHYYLDFEKPVADLENKIEELKHLADGRDIFIKLLTEDFIELHGDRKFSDDPAIVCGVARFQGISVAVIGHQKGRGTKERIERNFGQPHPEGYRKALRIMKLAERFSLPIITFIDTPGAYPGIGAEERGQAEAIATNLLEMSTMKTPVVTVVIGEGGSGGALALAVADRILMLEHSVYSVISPEGCAAILWNKNGTDVGQEAKEKASDALKLTAQDLYSMGLIDEIITEPIGGAHRDYSEISKTLEKALKQHLDELIAKPVDVLVEERYLKFRMMGKVEAGG